MPITLDSNSKLPISSEIQKLAPDSLIELFVLDLTALGGGVFNFHAGTNALAQPIVWQGVTYSPMPIMVEGFTYDGQGALPRPKLRVANVTKLMSSFVTHYEDMVGARVIRKRTFARYLDGQAAADPSVQFPDETWLVDKKTMENRLLIEWELSSPFDTEGVMIPARTVLGTVCPWKYRGEGCGYTGTTYFKLDNTPTTDPTEDACGKHFTSCKLRFGRVLPFGGFPGVKKF